MRVCVEEWYVEWVMRVWGCMVCRVGAHVCGDVWYVEWVMLCVEMYGM